MSHPAITAHGVMLMVVSLLIGLLVLSPTLIECKQFNASTRLTDPAHTVTIGFVQYLNAAVLAGKLNLTNGYELDAMEFYVAAQTAIEDINSNRYAYLGLNILDGYTLELDVKNTQYYDVQAQSVMSTLLDSTHNPAPPPIAIGLVGFEEANGVAEASQPFQTPIISYFVSTPSLTTKYPNFNRYCVADQIETFGLLAMFNSFGWKSIAALFNNDGSSSTQLVTTVQQYATNVSADANIQSFPYTFTTSSTDLSNVRAQLKVIKAIGTRIILLSESVGNIASIIQAANELGMIGAPYTWVGTSQWCFDSALYEDPVYGHLFDGLVCTDAYLDMTTGYYQGFVDSRKQKYEQNPASTFYIPEPSLSAGAYDTVFGAAIALTQLLEIKKQCNISLTGSNGRPFSGLIPPDLTKFSYWDYASGVSSTGLTIEYTQSEVPTTVPEVCPWLLYQVGQGRVLTSLIRSQVFHGSTGDVLMFGSGDRSGAISVYNVYNHTRKLVGIATNINMFAQFGLDISQSRRFNDTSNTTSSGGVPLVPVYTTGPIDTSWLNTYNASTFSVAGHYGVAYATLGLAYGHSFSTNVFAEYWAPETITWVDGTHTVPLDAPIQVIVIQGISSSARAAVFALTIIVAVYAFLLFLFQIRYRKEKLIKMSSPTMNMIFLLGALGMLIYVILLGLDSSQVGGVEGYKSLCHIKFAILSISFSIAFGSLFAKTYRLDHIFNSKHLHVRVVRDRDIVLIVAALVVIDIIILAIWQGYNPFYQSLTSDAPSLNPNDVDQLDINSREKCGSGNFTDYVGAFLAYKGFILLNGLYLALRIRKINIPNLNDSKFIVMSIYNVVMISILLIIVALVLEDKPDTFYLLVGLGILYLVVVVLSLLFLPRVLTLLWGFDFSNDSTTTAGGTGDHNVVHANTSSENNALRSDNEKLKIKLQTVQHDLADLKRAVHHAGVDLKPHYHALSTLSTGAAGANNLHTPSASRKTSVNRPPSHPIHLSGPQLTPAMTPTVAPNGKFGGEAIELMDSSSVRIHVHLENEDATTIALVPMANDQSGGIVHIDPLPPSPSIGSITNSGGLGGPSVSDPKITIKPHKMQSSGGGGGGLPGSAAYNSQIGTENASSFGQPSSPSGPPPQVLTTLTSNSNGDTTVQNISTNSSSDDLITPPPRTAIPTDTSTNTSGSSGD